MGIEGARGWCLAKGPQGPLYPFGGLAPGGACGSCDPHSKNGEYEGGRHHSTPKVFDAPWTLLYYRIGSSPWYEMA